MRLRTQAFEVSIGTDIIKGVLPMFFSLMAAFFYGLDPVFVKKGLLKDSDPRVAAIVTLSVNTVFFLILSIFVKEVNFIGKGFIYFVLAGVFAPGIARLVSYKGIEKLGASVSTPLMGMETVFSFILAILFLGERTTPRVILGASLIVLGSLTLTKKDLRYINPVSGRNQKVYVLFPIFASFLYGTSIFLRKFGLIQTASPIIGAFITSCTSLITLQIFFYKSVKRVKSFCNERRRLTFFLLSGMCTSLAWLFLFYALSIGEVVVVSPIVSSYPLFTLLLSPLFIGRSERITCGKVIGVLLIIAGIWVFFLCK